MMDFAAITDKGKSRKDNEDFFTASRNLFIVADGMGGHKAGDVASKLAVQTIAKLYRSVKPEADRQKVIERLFKEANMAVMERASRISSEQGMGTTLTLMLIHTDKAYFGHIGDSRAYLFRNNKLNQLTSDHSLVADMVQDGRITEEEARAHPYRNVITKALGSEEKIKPDIFSIDVNPGDRILICSDGLTSMVDDSNIQTTLQGSENLKAICSALVKKANDNGGSDNITAIIVNFDGVKPKKRLTKIALASMALLLTILISSLALNSIINNSFYIGFSGRKVALYRGLPYKFLSWDLHKTAYVSDINRNQMPSLWRERVTKTFSVDSYKKGMLSIKEIEKDSVSKKP